MVPISILAAGHTDALEHAVYLLTQQGFPVTTQVSSDVTHLLLPVPSFEENGSIKGGGDLRSLLDALPKNITVIGGNLQLPSLSGYRTADLLKDTHYLAMNARITAYCAISLAMDALRCTLDQLPTLVIGWGRIGKCLVQLLSALNADVTVAARKESDRAALRSLGVHAIDIPEIQANEYRLIINTVPQMLLPNRTGNGCKIDLASKPGIGGNDVIHARGLPGKLAPESSGALIAETVISYLSEKEVIL